jgi:hypothetical protein
VTLFGAMGIRRVGESHLSGLLLTKVGTHQMTCGQGPSSSFRK